MDLPFGGVSMWVRQLAAGALSLAAFVLVLSFASGQEEEAKDAKRNNEVTWTLEPGTSQFRMLKVPARKRLVFLANGTTQSARLGIYVYDTMGNCIAWDDVGNGRTSAVVAADVAPGANSHLEVEVHNLGLTTQKTTLTTIQPSEAP